MGSMTWTHIKHMAYGLLIAAGVGALEEADTMSFDWLPGPLAPILGIVIGWALGQLKTLEAKETSQ